MMYYVVSRHHWHFLGFFFLYINLIQGVHSLVMQYLSE